tara:strand:- start:324 stop:560 length:237 start_codon:yes stop_codon:yes gene_type:complete
MNKSKGTATNVQYKGRNGKYELLVAAQGHSCTFVTPRINIRNHRADDSLMARVEQVEAAHNFNDCYNTRVTTGNGSIH